jgi:hypothetical protein
LTATSFAIGGAAETALPPAVTVATAAADAAPASQATSVRAATIEAVAPTAGADLAMWGVDPSTQATPAESRLSGSRLVRRFADGIINRSAQLAVTLTRNAMRFLGVPYVFGGTSSSGFDCSGYVQHVFAMLGYHIPRTADAQYYAGKRRRRDGPGRPRILSNVRFWTVTRRDLPRQRSFRARFVEPRRDGFEPSRELLVGAVSRSKTTDLVDSRSVNPSRSAFGRAA